MNGIMYAQSPVSAALLIFYTCLLLPYRELKHAVSRILCSVIDPFCPRAGTTLYQPYTSFELPASAFRELHAGVCSKDDCRDHDGDCGCAICLEGFEDDDVVSELSRCGHFFHRRCIETWVEHRFQFTCPLCRSLIFK
ncbi:hypothetical protein MLD38_022772 [Melastoma candidum]|uniref:Uncharacterized protein n=1 Tax=Melastoma candidum TaxID=119954 RepID=A0ACB9QNF8_9MYRT|nr:hypothetical protein MLD38_022772 [Melastoma candidum]